MGSTATYRNVNEVIDNLLLMSKDESSHLYDVPPFLIRSFARKGVREMVMKQIGNVRGLRIDVNTVTNTVELPQDYVKYIRVSKVNECGTLQPIAINNNTMTASQYLRDHLNDILLDSDGIPLRGSGDSDIDRFCTSYSFDNSVSSNTTDAYISTSYYTNINNTFVSGVTFVEDDTRGILQLSGTGVESVVVEYIFDPYKETADKDDLEINTLYADALERYVYKELISRRRSTTVDSLEKVRAERDYNKAIFEAKLYHKTPALQDIIRVTNL